MALEILTSETQMEGDRIAEAIAVLRFKDVQSTTLERLRLTAEIDVEVAGLPQALQLGKGLFALLDRIAVPISSGDLILGRILETVPDTEGETLFHEQIGVWNNRGIPPWMPDGGHECLAWDRLLRLGLPGLALFAREELARREASGASDETLDFLRGAVGVYEAFRNYARRYARAAQDEGLEDPAANCAAIAERAPETFSEAIQLMWLVGHVYCTMLSQNPTLTFGRMDDLLWDFYRRDLAAGRLTREEAGDLVGDFYCKHNLVLGRGEHQMSGGSEKATGWARNLTYDAPQYVVLGGRRVDDGAVANDLTRLFLERIVPRFENPVMVLRYTSDLPDDVWRLACEKMRDNASFMVYNDENIIPAMIHSGIDPDDAVTYTMHGCNWPDVPGVQRTIHTQFVQLPALLRAALMAMDDARDIEDVYAAFEVRVVADIEALCDRVRSQRAEWDARAPGRLRVDDCFLDGPIANARSWQLGGVKYTDAIAAISGIASVSDAMAVIDWAVFQAQSASLGMIKQGIEENFEGNERLRQMCVNAPKFGQDDDRADRHAVRILDLVLDAIDRESRAGDDEVIVFRCLETDMRHLRFGKELGATADGRLAGEPISENTSPYPGVAKDGLTAMLRSVAKLPLSKIHSGALNVRLQPRLFAGKVGLDHLATTLRTYFDLGGLQVQLSVVDVDELRDAQAHPERHRDLMVRITGYSAAFVDMSRVAQDEIIRREEMGA